MATAEEALRARLVAVAGITALVGSSPARVYPVKLPQSATLPAITYQRISTVRENAMGADPGIARARFQVTSWATSYSGVKALSEAVRAGLQRYDGTSAAVVVLDTFLDTEIDLFGEDEEEAGIHAVAQDYTMIHRE